MAIPNTPPISTLDILKEFSSVSAGNITSLVNNGGGSWSWTQSVSAAIGDVLYVDDFATNESLYGVVTTGGTNVTVRWYGTSNPYTGMPLLKSGPNMKLQNFYRGGALVPNTSANVNIPTSGTIKYSNFLGAVKQSVYEIAAITSITSIVVPAGTWYVYTIAVGAGGGGGGTDEILGASGGYGGSLKAKFQVTGTSASRFVVTAGTGGAGGASGAGWTYSGQGGRVPTYTSNTSEAVGFFDTGSSWYIPYTDDQWIDVLRYNSVWNTEFIANGLSARVPTTVRFPTSGNYIFYGMSDDDYILYLDSTTNAIANFGGYTSLKSVTVFVTAGWHTLYHAAQDTFGVARAMALLIYRASDNLNIFNTRAYAGGGTGSGGFEFLNGGMGGQPGKYGASAAGGGGGSASALLWYPNNDPLTGDNYSILAMAPGGGGGGGAGRFLNATATGGKFLANWNNRGLTLTTSVGNSGNPDWWNNYTAGYRTPYNVTPTLMGQGAYNMGDYYPASTDPNYNNLIGTLGAGFDGGGGGGGGAPWGRPGAIGDRPASFWTYYPPSVDKSGNPLAGGWNPPVDSSGSGGNQGYIYLNGDGNYVKSYLTSETNTYYNTYGLPGGPTGGGSPGAIKVRITNVDDGIYPTP